MPIHISRRWVDFILLGPEDDRRQLQESPVLGDVWIAFANEPCRHQDLLIEPYLREPAGRVAAALSECIDGETDADIAYLKGLVAARLTFEELLRYVIPMTKWWHTGISEALKKNYDGSKIKKIVKDILKSAPSLEGEFAQPSRQPSVDSLERDPLERWIVLSGTILWAADQQRHTPIKHDEVTDRLIELFEDIERAKKDRNACADMERPLVWQVSLNRRATPALAMSVPAVKADAARTLFSVRCDEITWAVIDSGIDGTHPAFRDNSGQTRVVKSYDFSNIRKIVSLDNRRSTIRDQRLDFLLHEDRHLAAEMERRDAAERLAELAEGAAKGQPVRWDLAEKFVEISFNAPPYSSHGTHVAGIIGASRAGYEFKSSDDKSVSSDEMSSDISDGMCPDIKLYDVRVLARTESDSEFAIIAALQYLRYLNEQSEFRAVHGANLSLSIPHDVRNFACGRTPVCSECERLVESGVVVVVAAGNRGYQAFQTREGSFEGYAAFSLTDPGNADGVITVGATHRFWPHTYGVSFFSSRGPTGDGRLKPDLVAPGERIRAPLPNQGWGQKDGTSMAAPHVSGAAAMLMSRYTELRGQPRRIKRIICDTATDLGRERSFQGSGMLDVLRAFQSV